MLTIISLFMFILFPTFLLAATKCIRSGGSGTTCADWGANACNALPSTLVRGDTYYIASGSYSGRTFSTATSGTTLITIKGATSADHGAAAGWSNSYSVDVNDGGKQAQWTSGLNFTTSYWVFDGSVGSMTKTSTAYGFSFGQSINYTPVISTGDAAGSHITISHVYAQATSADQEKMFFRTAYGGNGQEWDYITISYSLLDGWQNGMESTGIISNPPANNGWVFDHNMALNGYSSPAWHGEWINANSAPLSNDVVSNNYFEGILPVNNGMTAIVVANNNNNTGALVYGNVFNNVAVGNGIVSDNKGALINARVYNNTFANSYVSTCAPLETGSVYAGISSGNISYNNLFYNMRGSCYDGSTYAVTNNFNTMDYDMFIGTYHALTTETHRQTGTASPFVGTSYGDQRDFYLNAPTNAGTALASPFNVDPLGNTRGADGVWDRGAYEFLSGGTVKPMPPNLH